MSYCSKCGTENPEQNNFCSGCGQSLHSTEQQISNNSPVYAILGWVFSGISILFIPILFAAGGVIFGYLHRKVNQTHGTIIIISAIACGLFGTVLAISLSDYNY